MIYHHSLICKGGATVLGGFTSYISPFSVIVVVSITVLFYDDKGPFITTTLPMTFLHSYMPGKWKQIATTQMEKHLVTTVEDMRQQAKRWMDTYNFDVIENLVAPPKCVVCGEQAAKRCSKCRQEWYAITLPSSGVVQCASFTCTSIR